MEECTRPVTMHFENPLRHHAPAFEWPPEGASEKGPWYKSAPNHRLDGPTVEDF